MDRSWMDRRVVQGIISDEYREGVEHFCDFAFDNAALLHEGRARCPCNRCGNRQMLDRSTITVHLYRNGFMSNYKQWYLHGETWRNVSMVRNEQEMDTDRMVDMVMDAAGPEFNWNTEEDPEAGSSDFYRMMKDADEPLWPGCETHTVLSAVSELLNLKAEFNMTVNCYDRMVAIIKKMLPKDEKLVGSFYASKKMVKGLGMGYEKIDACQNDCMIFYKENQDKSSCGACGANRFKPRQEGRNQKDIPYKVLRYLPITPRLQRLYLSKSTAGHMRWHKQPRKHPDMMCHPSDSEAWKQFDARHPSFAQESRNVRLGLSTDGFTPFGHAAAPYSCWPVFITPYNLPPGMCMKEHNIFLTLVIPGPRHPGRSIDVYLRPLVDELKLLWTDGIRTFDVSKKQNFLMKATLLWTISDFPAYGMLSGWSTHGKLACPHCMESTKSFHLEHGRKPCWFDCHRQFLPEHHPFRKQRDNFRRNKIEKDHAPQRLSGMEVFQRVSKVDEIQFGRQYDKQKSRGFGRTHNWVKQSIFWELPYWITNLIRHNLDVMHIEKNIFDNVFYTVMDVKGKTKDNPKARADMKNICKRPQLELVEVSPNKFIKPKASYTLTRQQIKDVCEWCKSLKFPDGYASNISRCVNVKDCRFYGLKSHDCHIFMQRLLPLAWRDLLPNSIWSVLTELSLFFRDICATEISVDHISSLEKSSVEMICKLEKIFPPGFFDSMEHLVIHLAYEARVGGPVQYRWMYPFERYMHSLKKKVKNKARVEGSIVEAYILEEISNFSRHYFNPSVQTKMTQVGRNDDGGAEGSGREISIFAYPAREFGHEVRRTLSDTELRQAETYVLLNCEEIDPYVLQYDNMLRRDNPTITDQEISTQRSQNFACWFRQLVVQDNDSIPPKLRPLGYGPEKSVPCYNGCNVNGFKFHTLQYGKYKSTMNSGVCIKGSWWEDQAESDYYGLLEEVIKLSYVGSNSVILFKCQWFDNINGMKADKRHGIIEVKHGSKAYVNEPFVLASQAAQVYYTPFASRERGRKDWWAVCKTKSRAVQYALDEEEEPQLPEFFQEDETIGVHQSFNDDDLDAPGILLHEDDQHEEVEPIEIGLRHNPPQEDEDEEEEEEEVEEEEENDEESEEDSERYQTSEEAD